MDPEISVNGHKLRISARDVVQFVVLGLSIVGIYFISSNRITATETSINDLYTKNAAIVIVVAEMDKNGTHRSHETDATQQQQIDRSKEQIADLNREINTLSPKVDKIDTNVLWLMAKQLEHK